MGKKGTKRKTRWRVLPIGGEDSCNGVCSNNEDEGDADRDSTSPAAQQRMPRTKPRSGNYNYRHRSYYQQAHDNHQPLVTTEKKTFNEEEYTKITTPRQDVLFKKGYLGRKRPTAETTATVNGSVEQNVEVLENEQPNSEIVSPVEEQPQYIYATNGYVDQTGGPPPSLYYINGSGYELYDPYSGNVTVVVGPAPHYGGPGGGPPVLAAVPCQPLPLQPLEWFNPAFLPYVTAPCHNGLATARDRRKRYSTDSQNCSPQSSESTEPPGSPQECEMEMGQPGEPPGPTMYQQPPAYVYPGYMFGPPVYSVNGVTVQGAPTQPPSCDVTGSNKRRKKKRRRRRRRGGAEDGCSEETSSDEKELEEPMSVTSQESSSQEIESDSKQSTNTTTLNNDSSSSPLSSCQTLTPTDQGDASLRLKSDVTDPSTKFVVSSQAENLKAPPAEKDSCSEFNNCNLKIVPVVNEEKDISQNCSQQEVEVTKDLVNDLNSIEDIKDQGESEIIVLHSTLEKSDGDSKEISVNTSIEDNSSKEKIIATHTKCEESVKISKNKKSGKQSNVKNKKNSKGKEDKQKRPTKVYTTINDITPVSNKKKDELPLNGPDKLQRQNYFNMDGNEKKSPLFESSSKQVEEGEDLEKSEDEPPLRPLRKEKQALPSTSLKSDDETKQLSEKCSIAEKSELLPQISLRPDVPKIQHEASSSLQFKGTTDILDSITEALIKEPLLQSTVVKPKHEVKSQGNEECPVPPPRCKKPKSVDPAQTAVLDLEGGNVMEESSGDSSTSSTTHESEESVIELLSSTHTRPDHTSKQLSSDEEDEDVIFSGKKPPLMSESMDLKSIPPDKSNDYTPSISGPSLKDSSQILEQDKHQTSERLHETEDEMCLDIHNFSVIQMEQIEIYATKLSENILLEATHESAKKRMNLPITEAVTRWLRSQSPEVLSLPPPEDESDTDISSEEQENDEDKPNETGQKNVLCNPLPVPLPEKCHHLLVNDIDHSGCINGIGRRVALNKNNTTYLNDNNESCTCVSEATNGGKKENICEALNSSRHCINDFPGNDTSSSHVESNCNYIERSKIKDNLRMKKYCKKRKNSRERLKSNLGDGDEFSFTSDEALECEWDLWECGTPVKNSAPVDEPDDYCSEMCDPTVSVAKYYNLGALQPNAEESVTFATEEIDSSEEEVEALKHFQYELEDDDGLQTKSIQEKEADQKMNIEGDSPRSAYNASLSQRAHAASSILMSSLKGDGPFPCGGICCILQ